MATLSESQPRAAKKKAAEASPVAEATNPNFAIMISEEIVVETSEDEATIISVVDGASLAGATLAGRCGLSIAACERLCSLRAPAALFAILTTLHAYFPGKPSVHCLDGFCGVGNVAKAFQARGLCAIGYDRVHCRQSQDILTPAGFCTALLFCRQLLPGSALAHWGPMCSSWVYLSRGSSGRRVYNVLGIRPDGSTSRAVREGNLTVSRLVLLLMVCSALDVIWIVEQPQSSLLFLHKRMRQLCELLKTFSSRTWMGAYGAASAKLTMLLCNHPMVYTLQRKLHKKTFIASSRTYRDCADGTVTGTAELAASQVCPPAYGEQVCDSFVAAALPPGSDNCWSNHIARDCVEPQAADLWKDAELEAVCAFLGCTA